MRIEHPNGERLAWAVGGETVAVAIDVEAIEPLESPIVGFLVRDRLGQNIFGDNTFLTSHDKPLTLAAGDTARARFEFDLPLLPPGDYSIAVAVADGHQQEHVQHEWIHDALTSASRRAASGTRWSVCRCGRSDSTAAGRTPRQPLADTAP